MNKEEKFDFTAARKFVAENVRIWPHWTEGGDIGLIVNMTGPNGEPGCTIGSCKLSHAHEEISKLLRGVEIGVVMQMSRGV